MQGFEDCFARVFSSKHELVNGGILYRVPLNSEKGFLFDYLLFLPNGMKKRTTLILEFMNYKAGKTEHIEEKIEYMYEIFKSFRDIIHYCNQKSCFPILYPLIPRYFDLNLNEEIYVNMLSSNTFLATNPRFFHIDSQIICMVKDAMQRLLQNQITVDEKIIAYGFSGSGKAVDRFALLHSNLLKLVVAGGLAGTLILPYKSFHGEKLLYPVGIGNLQSQAIDLESFRRLKQFYYHGEKDGIDAFCSDSNIEVVPHFKGIITSKELTQLYSYVGKDVATRWAVCQKIYQKYCYQAFFETYPDGTHSPAIAKEKIRDLFEKEI